MLDPPNNGSLQTLREASISPLWESLLPEEVLRLRGELARLGALLDDPAFFAPFAAHFEPLIGRPSTPVECYLRPMFEVPLPAGL